MTETTETPLPLRMLNKAIEANQPLVDRYVRRLRNGDNDSSPAKVLRRLNNEFRGATISAGAGVGATAAAPGVGTGVALSLSGAEAAAFLEATALYVQARASLHGIAVHDVERRRALVLAIALGESATKTVGKMAERTGKHWAKQLVTRVPMSQIRAINKVLGRNFVTKYGTKQGIIVLGRVTPFGIGALIGGTANAAVAEGIIRSANRAFGPAPKSWEPSE